MQRFDVCAEGILRFGNVENGDRHCDCDIQVVVGEFFSRTDP